MMEEVDAARVEGMIRHVFFPRKLPLEQGKNFMLDDSCLLQLITKIVGETIGIPAEVVKLFDTWSSLQNGDGLDSSAIHKAILKLDVGDMFALYIRQQNTGLLISMPKSDEDDHAILSTFPASLKNSTITSSPALIAMEFPEQSITIPFSHVISSTTFSEQLSVLCSQNLSMSMAEATKSKQTLSDKRDVPDTIFVSKWIATSLSNRESSVCSRNEFPRIVKKIRDEVLLYKKAGDLSIPFRRSGFWMTMKVILQLSLIRHMGEAEGQFMYKLILVEMMRQICEVMSHKELDIDFTMQMLAKMGRRLEKFSEKKDSIDISESLMEFHADIHKNVCEMIVQLRKQIDNQYSLIQHQDKMNCELKPLVDLNFAQDIKQSAPNVRRYIQSRTTGNKSGQFVYIPKRRNIPRHELKNASFPPIENLLSVSPTEEEKMGIVLFDLENWIFRNLNPTPTIDFDYMRSLAMTYTEKALEYYKDDPIGVSRMVLALLKIIRVMDQNVCRSQTFSLLKEHGSGVNTEIIKDLLLPTKYEMEVAEELESYFDGRNETASENYPSLIGEEEVTENSFSSRFAALSPEMCEQRDRIIDMGEVKMQEKRDEIVIKKVEIAKLRRRFSLIPEHTYETRTNWRGNTFTNHNNGWSTCSKCEAEKAVNNCTVSVYEKPLREEEHYQNAVVFELMIPKKIACLRDVLFLLRKSFRDTKPSSTIGNESQSRSQSHNTYIAETWIENSELIDARTSHHHLLVQLGSSEKLFSHTHLNTQLADSPEYQIILDNSGSLTFYGEDAKAKVKITPDINEKAKFTFRVEENSPYKSMQWALNSTDPMENHALANQSQCSPRISFSEFITFGSLRSGHRLQLRNIYRALVTGNLSFKAESVVSLISQSLWEYGLNGESHQEIMNNSEFIMELGEGLNEFKESQRNNWKHPFNLLNVILITLRVLELTSDHNCIQKFDELLMSCREIVMEWFERIETVIQLAVSQGKSNVQTLRNILVDVGICGALTLGLNLSSRGRITELTASALQLWLSSIIKIENNLKEPSVFTRNLLRYVRNIGLDNEDQLYVLAEYNDYEFLNDFCTELWSTTGGNSADSSWKKMDQGYCKRLKDENGETYIELDFISGQFLVNGFSISRLPPEITSHQTFKRVFQKTIFEVQPDGHDTFVTVSKYNGSKYSFQLIRSTNMLIIKELCETGGYELIPHKFLQNELPHLLIVDYCHWWNRKERVIQFRPISRLLEVSTHQVHYILNLVSMELRENGIGMGRRFLIDICSRSFKNISTFLAGFELGKYLNIFVGSKNPDEVVVELPRMNLKFKVEKINETYRLLSQEYEDMYVCSQLKPEGVLLGLRNGLLLKDSNGDQKFLVPFGEVEVHALQGYQNVHICQTDLRRPSYFAYPVDEKFCQFKMGKSNAARFYLAYLHAVTSTAVEDPFTGMTGTEKALQILQSEYCWSSEPYDEESLEIMNQIKSLSPKRIHYDHDKVKSLVTVTWPTFMNASSAHELFDLIITRLIEDSLQLKFLYDDNINKDDASASKPTKWTNTGLNIKSYYRHLYYNPNLNVSDSFLNIEEKTLSTKSFLRVEKSFKRLVSQNPEIISSQDKRLDWSSLENMRIIPELGNEWCDGFSLVSSSQYGVQRLLELLTTGTQLVGISDIGFALSRIDEWMELDFENSWLNLYNFARDVKKRNLMSEWTLLMTALAFKGVKLQDLIILHTIAVNPEEFINLNPPNVHLYENPSEEFTKIEMSTVLRSFESGIENFLISNNCKELVSSKNYNKEYKEFEDNKTKLTEKYEASLKVEIKSLVLKLEKQWISKSSENSNSISASSFSLLKFIDAKPKIDTLLKEWNDNRKLREFLTQVSLRFRNISISGVNSVNPKSWNSIHSVEELLPYQLTRFEINYENKIIQNFGKRTVYNTMAEEVFRTGELPCPDDHVFLTDATASSVNLDILKDRQRFYKEQSAMYWKYLKSRLTVRPDNAHLILSGLFPRIVPTTMMSRIIPVNGTSASSPSSNTEVILKDFIGGLGVIWVLEQQATRMVKFANRRSLENSLRRELETIVEEKNWSPRDRPEWLIFELEQNLMIRRIQVEIANRMMDPPKERKGKHCVMQLNMGEGKTSVILPLIAASLSDGNQLCCVTVLQALFKTNLSSLREVLGGILHRRVYTLPCERNLTFEPETILKAYTTAKRMKGIVVTIPEYRLSSELKVCDAGGKDSGYETAKVLMDMHRWLNSNVRDVLDESDEILSAKYQLIYTQGKQCPPGGGELRWTIVQDLLKLIPSKMYKLWLNNQSNSNSMKEEIEFDVNVRKQNGKQVFWPCRFLSPKLYPALVNGLADDFLDGKTSIKFIELKSNDRHIIKEFITNVKVVDETHHAAIALCGGNEKLQNTIFILAGLFKYEVLRLVLSKRWRVNYGVNETGRLKMAVPFKAKDVAAETTEFGHPDVAVCLTHLSYYYSGLSYDQFKECFSILDSSLKASEIYDGWISKVRLPTQVPDSMKKYESVNLHDAKNRDDLYALLKMNMYVIDFWLSKTVLRREFRQYPSKMMCTAYDLCSEDLKLVTGFSGTNDSKDLLPTPMSQEDLEELENTNEEVRQSLLSADNNYKVLRANVSGRKILGKLVKNQIPVLLDAGALMLELNNEEVAREWLDGINYKRKVEEDEVEIEGAVYFNNAHVLMVIDRHNRIREFESSPFTERLDRCVVYLDDVHTRGTDLKFPKNTRACVTLTGGITRDKTVQACMRMRMLGKGHFISFFASQEAHNGIRDYCFGSDEQSHVEVTTKHVVDWIQKNSDVFVEDGLVHWAAAACNYALKRAAHLATPEDLTSENLKELSSRCSDKEVIDLMDYYGKVKKERPLFEIIEDQFIVISKKCETWSCAREAQKTVEITHDKVISRLNQKIPDRTSYTELLDEEQEKEIEKEVEQQVEVIKTRASAEPEVPALDRNITAFLLKGKHANRWKDKQNWEALWNNSLMEISEALGKTKFEALQSWGKLVFVTKDFLTVIKSEYSQQHVSNDLGTGSTILKSSYEYLRPVSWIATIDAPDLTDVKSMESNKILILLSSFEANEYFQLFHSNNKKTMATLHMYSPSLKLNQNTLLNKTDLQVPPWNKIILDGHLRAQLSVFSGSLYFQDDEEKNDYCHFTGFIPRLNRSVKHKSDFDNGLISNGGFVLQEHRKTVSEEILLKCKFKKDPTNIITEIAENHHGSLPALSDVASMIIPNSLNETISSIECEQHLRPV